VALSCFLWCAIRWQQDNITYQLEGMIAHDVDCCRAVETIGRAPPDGPGPFKGNVSNKVKPQFLCHGTTIANALSILRDGLLRTTDSIAGHGVCGFACEGPDEATLRDAWKRGAVGCYTRGAMFCYRIHGILVNAYEDHHIPVAKGATAYKRDQFTSHPSVIEFVSVTFIADSVRYSLSKYLTKAGYSETMHAALRDIKMFVDSGTPPPVNGVKVSNVATRIHQRVSAALLESGERSSYPNSSAPSGERSSYPNSSVPQSSGYQNSSAQQSSSYQDSTDNDDDDEVVQRVPPRDGWYDPDWDLWVWQSDHGVWWVWDPDIEYWEKYSSDYWRHNP